MTTRNRKPSRFAWWILEKFFIYSDRYLIKEDLEEEYLAILQAQGTYKAQRWIWQQTLFALGFYLRYLSIWRNIMVKNYLKITIRNIKKHKGYSFINISGLAVGMACCILILLWVKDELSYDRFHENVDTIYRVTEHQYNSSGDYFPVAVTPWPLAEALKNDFPEVIESTRLRILAGLLVSYKEKKFYERDLVAADPSFLKMFSFPLLEGDRTTALTEPNTILITEDAAGRYFGTEDPIGKILTFHNTYDFKVTGVLEDVPHNSHIQFDFLLPFESTLREFGWTDSWGTNNYTTYIQIADNASLQHISAKISEYLKKINEQTRTKLVLQPLTDIHLHSDYAIDLYGHTENTAIYVYAFSAIALFVLLIACINFMNLSTARSEKRSKEVGLRKVVGASRLNIISQFYGESLFLTLISFVSAIVLVYLLLPVFNNVSGKLLAFDSMREPVILIGLIGLMLITGIVSGSYPALVQSSFKPVDSIKGIVRKASSRPGKSLFRRTLVVTQFTLSIMLIVGTLIVHKQIHYMLGKKLGYEKESMVYFVKRANVRSQYDAFKSELLSDPNITGVTASSDVPTYTVHSTSAFSWEGKDPETNFLIHQFSVDYNYIKTFNMNIIAGRDFSKDFPVDASTQSFIVNETAVKAMALENPIGSKFMLYRNSGQIVGVVADFHFKSLQKEIEPLVLRIEPQRDSYVFVKFKSGKAKEVIASVTKVYNQFNPDFPLRYTFLDEEVERLYNSEQKTKTIFNYFTFVAIFIASLGLFGLASYMAQQKTKEIGIRKVLGASILNIVTNLSREFVFLVCVANAIAWPLAYLAMNEWLHNFAYRIKMDPFLFIYAGLVSTLLALLTVSYHTIKSALVNPVNSIRYE
ncbi:MAG: ABC transporter permease [Candidatus Aminicenantes bacterium]|jgi:ABC-type antimicrobial peptide transport system permease subunit